MHPEYDFVLDLKQHARERWPYGEKQAGTTQAHLIDASYYASASSTIPQTMASVVSIREAIEAAFCRAVRVTLAGSMTPALTRSSYCSVVALKPKLGSLWFLIFSATKAPSVPQLCTIC